MSDEEVGVGEEIGEEEDESGEEVKIEKRTEFDKRNEPLISRMDTEGRVANQSLSIFHTF